MNRDTEGTDRCIPGLAEARDVNGCHDSEDWNGDGSLEQGAKRLGPILLAGPTSTQRILSRKGA